RPRLDVEAFDIAFGGGVGSASRRQQRDPQPVLPRPGEIAAQAADIAAFEQALDRIGRQRHRPVDVGGGGVEPAQRAIGGGAVDQRVGALRIGLQHPVEIGDRLIVPAGAARRLGPVDEQVGVVRRQFQRRAGGGVGAAGVAGKQPGLPRLVEHLGAQRRRCMDHRLGQGFQPFGRRLVLLQADQRDGEAMVGGVRPAAVVPGLGHVARRRRVGLGEAQAALVHLGIGIVGFRRRRAQRLRLRPERRQRRAERIVGTGRAGGRAERRGEGEGKHRAPPLRPTLARHYHEGSSRPLIGVCVHWLWSAFSPRNYRVYTTGNGISLVGTWLQRVAVGWLTWTLTHSGTWLGVVSLADFLPVLFISPLAGALADRANRVGIIRITQLVGCAQASVLAVLVAAGWITVEILFALVLLLGISNAVAQP